MSCLFFCLLCIKKERKIDKRMAMGIVDFKVELTTRNLSNQGKEKHPSLVISTLIVDVRLQISCVSDT